MITNVLANNFSDKLGRIFLGRNSREQVLMCIAQGHKAETTVRLKTTILYLELNTQLLSNCVPNIGNLLHAI